MVDIVGFYAYERSNVLVGLSCRLRGKAQIGKGMWAMPDLMKACWSRRLVTSPRAGANTAWVPVPGNGVRLPRHPAPGVNHWADQRRVALPCTLINATDFDRGTASN